MKAKDSASSSGEIAVFQAYIDLIKFGARDHLGALQRAARGQFADHRRARHQPHGAVGEQMGGRHRLGAVLLISAAWLLITVLTWWAMRRHSDLAGTFA